MKWNDDKDEEAVSLLVSRRKPRFYTILGGGVDDSHPIDAHRRMIVITTRVEVCPRGTFLQNRVWDEVRSIRRYRVMLYSDIISCS